MAGADIGDIAYIEPAAGGGATVVMDTQATATAGYRAGSGHGLLERGRRGDGGRHTWAAMAVRSSAAATEQLHLSGSASADGSGTGVGGLVAVSGDVVFAGGSLSADGADGGSVAVDARFLLASGTASAVGASGTGGSIALDVSGRYLENAPTAYDASGATAGGTITVGGTAEIYGSGSHDVSASAGAGGQVSLIGASVDLFGAQIDASGATGGGVVYVGDPDGDGVGTIADRVALGGGTAIDVSATGTGDGGEIWIWSATETQSAATLTARGADAGGDGGFIEISSLGSIGVGGAVDAGAANGVAGTLLLDPHTITITDAVGTFLSLTNPSTGQSTMFGGAMLGLDNGNIVITAAEDDTAATDAGAVFLFDRTGTLLSTLTGAQENDKVGNGGLTAVGDGNFVVLSALWGNGNATGAGAVTWVDGSAGLTGMVSSTNSLVGSTEFDSVSTVTVLTNGNYVVRSMNWDNGNVSDAGAVTWGNGNSGVVGVVDSTNSLVGTSENDRISSVGVTALSNGNYVVISARWDNGSATDAGAVTWGDGSATGTRLVGAVDDTNSLVGSLASDLVGIGGVTELTNGNYVVLSDGWHTDGSVTQGAVTWGSGTSGVSGVVDSTNSLVGAAYGHSVGMSGVTALTNGNYVVNSPFWDISGTPNVNVGAVTWGSGTAGITGNISAANSLIGSSVNDKVGNNGVTALSNGNYVVRSANWRNDGGATSAGAVTWMNGANGMTTEDAFGAVSNTNSLVGTMANNSVGNNDIVELTNGNFVVRSTSWDTATADAAGAVTWMNGAGGTVGDVSAANSLVGSIANDEVGLGVTALTNGHYVVASKNWDNGGIVNAGAATWGNGSADGPRLVGTISAANSLVGSSENDQVASLPITALTNGNYVVSSSGWDDDSVQNVGAVTWGDGTVGTTGTIDSTNSLIGSTLNDRVSDAGVIALTNGNYVVRSQSWDNSTGGLNAGAVTWGDGTGGTVGTVSAVNSLVGSTDNDNVGSFGVSPLSNGNYLVRSPDWDDGSTANVGAVTWGDGARGVTGAVSSANSLVGSSVGDNVGKTVHIGDNGDVVVQSNNFDDVANNTINAGVAVWMSGASGSTLDGQNTISAANAVIGGDASAAMVIVTDDTNDRFIVSTRGTSGASAGVFSGGTSSADALVFNAQPGLPVSVAPSFLTDTLNAGTDLVLQANSDVVFDSAVRVNFVAGGGGDLTVQAGRSVLVNADINISNGNLTLIANETLANGVIDTQRDAGTAVITMAAGRRIDGLGTVRLIVRDGAGLTNNNSGAITLSNISAAAIDVDNLGAGAESDVEVTGTLISTGALSILANADVSLGAVELAAGFNDAATVQAGRSVLVNGNISTYGSNLTLRANAGTSDGITGTARPPGDAAITMANGTTISAGGGAVRFEIGNGAGLTHSTSGAMTLREVMATSIAADHRGNGSSSDIGVNGTLTAWGSDVAIMLSTLNGGLLNGGVELPFEAEYGSIVLFAPDIADNAFDAMVTTRLYEATILTHSPYSPASQLAAIFAVYAAADVSPGVGGGVGGGGGPIVPATVVTTTSSPPIVVPIIVQPGGVPGIQSDISGTGAYVAGGSPSGFDGGLSGGFGGGFGGGLAGNSGGLTGGNGAGGGSVNGGGATGGNGAGGGNAAGTGANGGAAGDGAGSGGDGSEGASGNTATNSGQGQNEQTVVSGIVPCGDADNQVSLVCAQ